MYNREKRRQEGAAGLHEAYLLFAEETGEV